MVMSFIFTADQALTWNNCPLYTKLQHVKSAAEQTEFRKRHDGGLFFLFFFFWVPVVYCYFLRIKIHLKKNQHNTNVTVFTWISFQIQTLSMFTPAITMSTVDLVKMFKVKNCQHRIMILTTSGLWHKLNLVETLL